MQIRSALMRLIKVGRVLNTLALCGMWSIESLEPSHPSSSELNSLIWLAFPFYLSLPRARLKFAAVLLNGNAYWIHTMPDPEGYPLHFHYQTPKLPTDIRLYNNLAK